MFIWKLIAEKLSGYDVLLFIGDSAWQPDTRVVRYRKLWRVLSYRGGEIVGGSHPQESIVEANVKITFLAICAYRNSLLLQ